MELKKIRTERIKELRTELKMTMQQLGDLLAVPKSYISLYESGTEPRSYFYIKLYELYKINPLWLMGFDTKKYLIESNISLEDMKQRIAELENQMKNVKEDALKKAIKLIEENLIKNSTSNN